MENFYVIIIAVLIVVIYFLGSKIKNSMNDKFTFYKELNNEYTTLVKLLYHDGNTDDLNKTIQEIIRKRADGRYVSIDDHGKYVFNTLSFSLDTFYDVMKKTQNKDINFILELDEKLTLQDLNSFLQNGLGGTISNNNFLQTYSDADKNKFIDNKTLLAYQKILNKEFIQLGLLHDGFGSYYLLMFDLNQEKSINKNINAIGLKYEQLSLESNFNLKDNNEKNFFSTINTNAHLKLGSKAAKGL